MGKYTIQQKAKAAFKTLRVLMVFPLFAYIGYLTERYNLEFIILEGCLILILLLGIYTIYRTFLEKDEKG